MKIVNKLENNQTKDGHGRANDPGCFFLGLPDQERHAHEKNCQQLHFCYPPQYAAVIKDQCDINGMYGHPGRHGQTEARIPIYQGESEMQDENRKLGEVVLRNLQGASRTDTPLEVTEEKKLRVRYALWVHDGVATQEQSEAHWKKFTELPVVDLWAKPAKN